MNILAFDTCFSACSVAVRAERAGAEPRVAAERRLMETGHAEALMPMIDRVMREAGAAFSQLDRIVVTRGPGTFTGVRTGVAAARALALATSARLVAVSSLWAIGMALCEEARSNGASGAILVAMDARKGQLYVQVIGHDGIAAMEPQLIQAEEVATLCPGQRLTVAGSATSAVVIAMQRAGRTDALAVAPLGPGVDQPDAIHLLRAAHHCSMSEPLGPLYLRPPDAKPQAAKSLPWSST